MIAKNKERFEQDQNLGLLDQVVTAQTKTNIIRLTKTFLTLSLTELASKCGIESPMEAEKLLVSMIQEGKIHASISQKDGQFSKQELMRHHWHSLLLQAWFASTPILQTCTTQSLFLT